MSNVETYFLIAVNEDGSYTTYADLPEEEITRNHTATTFEIYNTVRDLAKEMENQLMVERIAGSILDALVPTNQDVSGTVLNALKERGIKPDSAATNE
jgi:hypothetical protein